MHNARKEMNRALCKLRLCLLKPVDIDFIKQKLYEMLEIERERPGALPGNSLRAVKKAIEYLQGGDLAKTKMFIKSAMGYIQRDPMMQKRSKEIIIPTIT